MVNRLRWLLPVSFVFAAFLFSTASCLAADGLAPAAGLAAMVNGAGIPFAELEREVAQVRRKALGQGTYLDSPQVLKARRSVLENIIGRELLYQESLKMGITARERDVDARFESIRSGFPGAAEFQRALSETGFTPEALKLQIRRSIVLQQFIDTRIEAEVIVTEKETESFYRRNPQLFMRPASIRVRHILTRVSPGSDRSERIAARRRMEGIQKQLSSGGDFSSLARSYSEGPSGSRGGDLGYVSRGQMSKPFEDAAFALMPGQISDIVETDFGYHLIQAVDRQTASSYTYDEIREAIAQDIRRRRVQEKAALYVNRLKAGADVKRYPR